MNKITTIGVSALTVVLCFVLVFVACKTKKGDCKQEVECKKCQYFDVINCVCVANSAALDPPHRNCENGVYRYETCECVCQLGWTGENCDSMENQPPQITKGMSATITPSFGITYTFNVQTFEVKVKLNTSGQGADTLVLDGYNSSDEFLTFDIYVDLDQLTAPKVFPINRVNVANTVLPFHGDASKPGIPFVSPDPPNTESKMNIEYFQLNPLQIKGTFNCKLEEFGNSNNTVDVMNGTFGYK